MKAQTHFILLFMLSLLGVSVQASESLWRQDVRLIDEAWTKEYRAVQGTLSVPADSLEIDDPALIRRLYLTAVGRIPTVEELQRYLNSKDPDKWTHEVDRLLNSEGWVSHMSNWSADVFRLADRKVAGNNDTLVGYWNGQNWRYNKTWDSLVTEILTADGNAWLNPAAAFNIRIGEMPYAETGMMIRTLVGTTIECAQCHDHPFEDWTQEEFYELAAFWGGVKKSQDPLFGRDAKRWVQNTQEERGLENLKSFFNGFRKRIVGNYAEVNPKGRIKLPDDYRGTEFKPGEYVGARTPFGEKIQLSPTTNHGQALAQFAGWMTSPGNEQFSSVITNRMWRFVYGFPLYDPIDRYVPWSKTDFAELGATAQQVMLNQAFDLKAFQKVLLHTKGFRLRSNPQAQHSLDCLASRPLHRMSAEQVWDSLLALREEDPDDQTRRDRGGALSVGRQTLPFDVESVLLSESKEQMLLYLEQMVDTAVAQSEGGGRKVSEMRLRAQAPTLKNSSQTNVRASEIRSPAPEGHFLSIYGQSDRTSLNSKNTAPNLAQPLAMLNSKITQNIIYNKDSALRKSLKTAEDDKARIKLLFQTLYARKPNIIERNLIKKHISSKEDIQNLAHAMICSSEFLFIQ